jgi:hypothetical protein
VEVSRTTHLTQRLEQHLFESKLLRERIGYFLERGFNFFTLYFAHRPS